MPARSNARPSRTRTPEDIAAEHMSRAEAVLEAFRDYSWHWMLDAEQDVYDGLETAEAHLDLLDFIREQMPDDAL